MKYILVTGGVISGIGKGVVASSVGVILKQVSFDHILIEEDLHFPSDIDDFFIGFCLKKKIDSRVDRID